MTIEKLINAGCTFLEEDNNIITFLSPRTKMKFIYNSAEQTLKMVGSDFCNDESELNWWNNLSADIHDIISE